MNESTNQWVAWSVGGKTNKSVDGVTNRPNNKPTNRLINQSINQSIIDNQSSINRSINDCLPASDPHRYRIATLVSGKLKVCLKTTYFLFLDKRPLELKR